jgi:hypothetical protein
MLIEEIIQRVQSLYSKGVQSDDTRLSPIHIYSKVVTVRSRLLIQEAKKKSKINAWNYQTIPCVEMIPAPKHECPCLEEGCKVMRSKYKIPKPLSDLNNHLISSVTSIDGYNIYSETSWGSLKYVSGNKYSKSIYKYFIRNEYLYILDKFAPKVISVTGLFEDPLLVKIFPSVCDEHDCEDCNECVDFNKVEFPMDADLIEPLIMMAHEELVGHFSKSVEDVTNNSRDNLPEQTK